MNILLVLIPVSLALVGISLWAFFWAANAGQFDDLDTPAVSMLSDDGEAPRSTAEAPREPVSGTESKP